ncbi:MAG: hypothetical protein NZ750_06980 [Anaerolineae bacterium]|nr:hypothetical protein [Anaerolineae bacterium]MDW8170854.1 hypothetical protein [Anaerolineae bacterium]
MLHRLGRALPPLLLLVILLSLGAALLLRWFGTTSTSNDLIREFLLNPNVRPQLSNQALRACPDAPFILPSSGLIGLLWGDTALPYNTLRRHTGIDVFGDGPSGTVPIFAVYDGYLTRADDWLSTVIIRHDDPLQRGRTIWTYYTHMASRDGTQSYIVADYPRGTRERFVAQGTLLGYQGEYAGPGAAPIAMHLHLSIVTSEADGSFRNEAFIDNTLDPSPYFGLPLRLEDDPPRPIPCRP